jgi:hypothetical protein
MFRHIAPTIAAAHLQIFMAKSKSTKSQFPSTNATVEALTTTENEVPFPSPSVLLKEFVEPDDDALTEEERQLNAIEAQRGEIIGTVESKLRVSLADACAHLKLLTKLGINGILTRKDFADYRKVLHHSASLLPFTLNQGEPNGRTVSSFLGLEVN